MNELVVVNANSLPIEQRQFIDGQINQIIQQHRNNRGEINRLTFDCVAALTAGQARSAELAEQGFLDRLLGGITGKNQRLQSEINRNYAAAQYASQCCLQKLAENNLMTFELVATVNNKLNSFAVNVASEFNNVNREINNVYSEMTQGFKNVGEKFKSVDREIDNVYNNMNQGFKRTGEEFNNIYNILGNFFRQTQSDIIQLDQRLDRLEQNVKLLNWTNSIEYQRFNGVEYEDLSVVGKIICLTRDFYNITKGKWSLSDLLLLKRALSDVGLPSKWEITYLHFLQGLIEEPKFLKILLSEVNLDDVDAIYTTMLESVKKYQLLETTEKYQVDSVSDMMAAQGVELPQRQITTNMVTKYINNVASVSLKAEIPIYEFCLELLYNLEQIKYNQSQKQLAEQQVSNKFYELEAQLKSQTQEINNLRVQLDSKIREVSNLESQIREKNQEIYNLQSKSTKIKISNGEELYKMGYNYEFGDGVPKNYSEAEKYYKLAVSKGNKSAIIGLHRLTDRKRNGLWCFNETGTI